MRTVRLPVGDVLAALTAVALLAPETVAFCQIAGVPPARGLAAAPLCVVVFAGLNRARQLLVGSTAATAVISAAAVAGLADDPARRAALVAALTVLTGAVLLLTGALRCGWVARFLAPEALQGFLFGLAVVIVVRQLAVVVDVPTPGGNVFVRLCDLAAHVSRWDLPSLATGAVSLSLLVVLERRLPRVPATIVVLVLAALASSALDLTGRGVAHVARVPGGFPEVLVPDLSKAEWLHLCGTAAGLALVCFALCHGVAVRLHEGGEHRVDADRQMLGLGVANLLAGAVGGPTVTASPSASSAVHTTGGRTRWVPVLTAGLLLLVGVALTPVFTVLPEPALAAVVIMAVRPFLVLAPFRTYLAQDSRALVVAACAVLGVLTLTLVPGLVIAVVASLVLFVADASHLRVSELGLELDSHAGVHARRSCRSCVTVLHPDGQLFFANVGPLSDAVDAHLSRTDHAGDLLVLDLSASSGLPLAVVEAIVQIERRVTHHGRALALVHAPLGADRAVAASSLGRLVAPDVEAAVARWAGCGPRTDDVKSAGS